MRESSEVSCLRQYKVSLENAAKALKRQTGTFAPYVQRSVNQIVEYAKATERLKDFSNLTFDQLQSGKVNPQKVLDALRLEINHLKRKISGEVFGGVGEDFCVNMSGNIVDRDSADIILQDAVALPTENLYVVDENTVMPLNVPSGTVYFASDVSVK